MRFDSFRPPIRHRHRGVTRSQLEVAVAKN